MREEVEAKLFDEFPWMKPTEPSIELQFLDGPYQAYTTECGDGWYGLLRDMCKEIEDAYGKKKLKVGFRPLQIKNKFGLLRIYYQLEEDADETGMNIEIDNIISKYEEISGKTCERCGEYGTMCDNGWIEVMCEQCKSESDLAKA